MYVAEMLFPKVDKCVTNVQKTSKKLSTGGSGMKELVINEIKLRDNEQTGALGNLNYLELLALAYKLGVIR